MESKKDIGNYFKENLEHLDRSPSSAVWENIEKDLNKKKKKRRFFIWFFFAVFICGSTATYILLDSDQINQSPSINKENNKPFKYNSKINKNNSTIINSDKNNVKTIVVEGQNNSEVTSSDENQNQTNSYLEKKSNFKNNKSNSKMDLKNTTISENSTANNSKKTVSKTSKYSKINSEKNSKSKIKPIQSYAYKINQKTKTKFLNKKKSETNSIAFNDLTNKNNSDSKTILDDNVKSTTIETKTNENSKLDSLSQKTNSISEKKKTIQPKEKDSTSSVTIKDEDNGVIIAPYYGFVSLGNFGKGNTLSNNYSILDQGSKTTTSFGILVRWMGTERLGIQTGIGLINSNHFTKISKSDTHFINTRTIDLNTSVETINSLFVNENQVQFTEENSFIEVPIEAYYIISNKKFGLATSFGISLFILNKNEIYLESDFVTKFKIGNSKNVAQQSFSANAKLNLFYKLSKRVQFDLYPELQYQIMSYKDTSNYFPYYLSLKAGISYKL